MANIIEGNQDSLNLRYYGGGLYFARILLGASNPVGVPSALEQFETSLRDPIYYQLIKRIVNLVQKYKSYQGAYAQDALLYPGIKIKGIQIDRLVTYFEYSNSNLNNAIYYNEQEVLNKNNIRILARQYRLNHKPFKYLIKVSSNVAADAIVRVYLGPKYDRNGREINIRDNRLNFVELDSFAYKLQPGLNSIERNSQDDYNLIDRISLQELNNGENKLFLEGRLNYYGYPNRFDHGS